MNWKLTRPSNLNEFVGKNEIKDNLKTYINSAKQNNQTLDHCLFYGLPGTGKTSLAFIIANELKVNIKIIQGSSILKTSDIYNMALRISKNEIIFIDEIHAINPICFEALYSLMEDFSLDVSIGKEFNQKIARVPIPSFTLIGATNILSKIPQPLEDRFGIIFNFKAYNCGEIEEIIKNLSTKYQIKLSSQDIKKISLNCKGIPRIAIRLLRRIIDYMNTDENIKLPEIIRKIGILEDGLDLDDIYYLNILSKYTTPIGLKTIMQSTQWDMQFIENKIEPYLLSNGYIQKTSKGRIILQKANHLLKKYSNLL